ncbi:membrane protein [Clostridia bacterium]|nr:membrane protein [Clostridia bacterium]
MIGILIALLSGALMSIQGIFNTGLTKSSSMWLANSWVQFSAFLVCMIAWISCDRKSFVSLFQMQPKYMLLGGVIGAFITYTVIKSMSMLGPAKAVMIILVAQLLVAYLTELFGMFGVEKVTFEWKRLFGMLICIAGILIFKWD